ncbi:COMM domain-containing protein 10 [Heterostelium album PN500]|uniref:COMM domain-containing protein 10 n=1 Tax=Heterostelium pallidum (strain ATCC 26659 / Pp 5 / PN500) TaxID=670386 RepID=D3BSD3_HETP5|nr:COMM domain-containing protein 10 [Heterostelium album PN500]EFA75706.1 COMM domain-containing protein 10 [Heterostelium album PN500]|eukprot:XP_020427840.1 COMM domain-containing protein 10 [Heterostelium album PN500]
MSATDIFTTTSSKFNDSLVLINKLDSSKFPRILSRIVQKIGCDKSERIFSQVEEEQLQGVLGLAAYELKAIIEACSFIFEQTAYYSLSGNSLIAQLQKTTLQNDKITAFQSVWTENAESTLQQLRSKSVAPLVLGDIGWRFHLQMSQSSMSKIKQPSAIFEFDLKSDSKKDEKMVLEFNKEQLQDFFLQLELVQAKLDSLA